MISQTNSFPVPASSDTLANGASNVPLATLDALRKLVYDSAAIVLEREKAYLLEARLAPVLREEGLPNLDALVARMQGFAGGPLRQRIVEAMTTNETSFFRDIHPFTALRETIIPQLLESNRAARSVDIWCGASSTGQEPYSIAMLLREHFPALRQWRVRILATDYTSDVLNRARAGRFSQIEVNRGLPTPLLLKYFRQEGIEWVIKDEIREMVEFQRMNLIERWPVLPRMDVVFLRNVLIYFDARTKAALLPRIHRTLRPSGYLFLGAVESVLNIAPGFVEHQAGRTLYYRTVSTGV